MSVNDTVKEIREQLKAIKQAVAGIEFRLSQLESVSQAPPRARSDRHLRSATRSRAEATLQAEGEAA
jgi:hypothetical protein